MMSNFSEISKKYEKDSVVQKSASEILFDLLEIQPKDDVLDLGCGTGHISRLIRAKTRGKVVGVDPSDGMIEKAKEKFLNQDISFHVCSAEQLHYQKEFDIIFCNSAFQWLVNPARAIKACHNSFKINGKMAIQAPAKDDYCPNFLKAIDDVKNHKATQKIFKSFTNPWFFRNKAREYAELFESAGFKVEKSTIDEVVTHHTAEEVYKIFESGAAAGYLNQDYYSTKLSQEYINAFMDIVRGSFEKQTAEMQQVRLTFYRIYLLAIRSGRTIH
ncbi:MAG: methyltransferase domain-containing protein [Desulfobacterales bacterium]|jgi:ubiquinone/menaquinone biosynthesis C-methylase UbiE